MPTNKERVLKAVAHLEQHLDDELTLEGLAKRAHFSPFHFHRVFKAYVGEPPMEHVRRLRLERAALRLRAGDTPVGDLAAAAGYESHEAFTRAFRGMFGVPPSEYRAETAAPPPADDGSFRFETLPELELASIRHVGPYENIPNVFDRLRAWAGERGVLGPEALLLGIGHDDPRVTPPEKLRFDCSVVLDGDAAAEDDVQRRTIGGGSHAILTHRGPFDGIGASYAKLVTCGRQPRSGPFEIYLNHPFETPPEEIVAEICLPVAES